MLRQAANLLIEEPATKLEHWLQLAGNATVRVSFPYNRSMYAKPESIASWQITVYLCIFFFGHCFLKFTRFIKPQTLSHGLVDFTFTALLQAASSLNRIIKTETLAEVDSQKSRSPTTWTLLRPGVKKPFEQRRFFVFLPAGSWNMRFIDAVGWAQGHPQEIYMNQAMLADLGSNALNQLKLNMTNNLGLKLVSPSLWLSSSHTAVSGWPFCYKLSV